MLSVKYMTNAMESSSEQPEKGVETHSNREWVDPEMVEVINVASVLQPPGSSQP